MGVGMTPVSLMPASLKGRLSDIHQPHVPAESPSFFQKQMWAQKIDALASRVCSAD